MMFKTNNYSKKTGNRCYSSGSCSRQSGPKPSSAFGSLVSELILGAGAAGLVDTVWPYRGEGGPRVPPPPQPLHNRSHQPLLCRHFIPLKRGAVRLTGPPPSPQHNTSTAVSHQRTNTTSPQDTSPELPFNKPP